MSGLPRPVAEGIVEASGLRSGLWRRGRRKRREHAPLVTRKADGRVALVSRYVFPLARGEPRGGMGRACAVAGEAGYVHVAAGKIRAVADLAIRQARAGSRRPLGRGAVGVGIGPPFRVGHVRPVAESIVEASRLRSRLWRRGRRKRRERTPRVTLDADGRVFLGGVDVGNRIV